MEIVTKQQKIDLLESAFGESLLSNSGKNISVVCPVCKSNSRKSKKKKLSICLDKGIYHCWVCEAKGRNIASFANKFSNINKNTFAELTSTFNLEGLENEIKEEKVIKLPDDFSLLCFDDSRQAKIAKRYLNKRGLTPDDLIRFKIGISSESEFINRIIFPSFSEKMELNF